MPNIKKIYTCQKCGAQFSKWNGRCLECEAWGTLKEELLNNKEMKAKEVKTKVNAAEVIDLEKLDSKNDERIKTGVSEIDRVLGGGFKRGSILLFSGEPGIGKSTILAQIANRVGKKAKKAVYVSGEESAFQVKDRFKRLSCDLNNISFIGETNVEKIVATLDSLKPEFVIIDSIQTVYSSLTEGGAGGINQIRASSVSFLEVAKSKNITIVLVGHITKDGQVAGPKTLEHLVDAVINLESQKTSDFRVLRAQKNRFGAVSEIGVFEMTGKGFKEIKNPSLIFLDDNLNTKTTGSAISSVVEGTRPFLVEIQALVSKTVFGLPQRKSSGFDLNRLQVLVSVLSKRAGVNLLNQDVILNVVGGLKVSDPALDLPVCAAILSSMLNFCVDKKTLILGEVGLGGEVRSISRVEDRIKEAKKLGFKRIVLPKTKINNSDISLKQIENLDKLIDTIR